MNSTFTKLSGETLQTSLKQSQSSCTKSSATQISELAEIKSRLEENNALAKETVSETKVLSSKFDMYVGFRSLLILDADAFVQGLLQEPWPRYPLVHAKDMVSLEHLLC